MDKDKKCCTLCDTEVTSLEYDLLRTTAPYSKKSLLCILVETTGVSFNFNNTGFLLCNECYLLLHELDQIRFRAATLENQLKNYLECRKNKFIDANENPELGPVKSQFPQLTDEQGTCFYGENPKQINEVTGEVTKPQENELPKTVKCSHCPKLLTSEAKLKNHLLTHSNDRPFVCELCGQTYRQEKALKVHIGMHNGIHPFTCQFCNKSFTQKCALVRHLPLHTGELPYQCDLCGKRFVHHTSFRMHKLSHSGEKSFECEVCGLVLLTQSHLKRHKRAHTGEKRFSCTKCGKRFAERYNLRAHEKTHIGKTMKSKKPVRLIDTSS